MKRIRTPETRCPHCQKRIDSASCPAGKAEPMPGDITICFGCTGVLKFDQNLKLAKLDRGELDQIRQEDAGFYAEIQRLRATIRLSKQDDRA